MSAGFLRIIRGRPRLGQAAGDGGGRWAAGFVGEIEPARIVCRRWICLLGRLFCCPGATRLRRRGCNSDEAVNFWDPRRDADQLGEQAVYNFKMTEGGSCRYNLIMEALLAIVGFILAALAFPNLIRHRSQYFAALGAVGVVIVLDALAHVIHSDGFDAFAYFFCAAMQVCAVGLLVMSAGDCRCQLGRDRQDH